MQVRQIFDPSFDEEDLEVEAVDRDDLTTRLHEDALGAYAEREEELGDELMRNLERAVLLQIIDERWREHLYDMDYLREGIHLRGFAQRDPLVEYKNEGFALFRDLMNSIWEDFGRYIFHVQVEIEPAQAAALRALVADAAHVEPHLHGRRPRAALGALRRRGAGRRRRWRTTARSSPRCRRSRRATSTRRTRSAATTRAGAGRARSTRSATGHSDGEAPQLGASSRAWPSSATS